MFNMKSCYVTSYNASYFIFFVGSIFFLSNSFVAISDYVLSTDGPYNNAIQYRRYGFSCIYGKESITVIKGKASFCLVFQLFIDRNVFGITEFIKKIIGTVFLIVPFIHSLQSSIQFVFGFFTN